MGIERSDREKKEIRDVETVSKVLTPGDKSITHEFTTPDNKTFFVVEVKGCQFEGYQICLSTREILRIPRMHAMKKKMYRFWEQLTSKGGGANMGGIIT